jgi:hypothetical protein
VLITRRMRQKENTRKWEKKNKREWDYEKD